MFSKKKTRLKIYLLTCEGRAFHMSCPVCRTQTAMVHKCRHQRRQNSSETAGSGLEGPEQPVDAKGLGDPIPRCGSEFLVSAILTCLEWYLDTQLAVTALSPDRHGPPGRNHLQRGCNSMSPVWFWTPFQSDTACCQHALTSRCRQGAFNLHTSEVRLQCGLHSN